MFTTTNSNDETIDLSKFSIINKIITNIKTPYVKGVFTYIIYMEITWIPILLMIWYLMLYNHRYQLL